MEFIAELIAEFLLLFGMFLIQWCIRHKKATLTLLLIALMALDVFVLVKYIRPDWFF